MEVTLLLCDAAQVSGGKLFILGGGWSHVFAPGTPISVALAILISVPWDQANQRHAVRAVLNDDAGQPVEVEGEPVMAAGQIEVGRPSGVKVGSDLNYPLAFVFQGLALRPGGYRWELEIDDVPSARATFWVQTPEE